MAYLPVSFSVPTATGSSAGVVQPDGTSILINGGIISAPATAAVMPQLVTVTGPAQLLNFRAGLRETSYTVTLGQNCNITIGNGSPGLDQVMTIDLLQGSGGGYVPIFANVSWPAGVPPAFNTAPGKRDTIQVRAVGSDIMGWPVSMGRAPLVAALPAAPTGVTVSAGTLQNTISASAVTASPPVTGYNIYAGATAGNEAATPIAANVALPYVDAGLPAGVPRYYTISAVNSLGEGGRSAEGSATPAAPASVPAAPTLIVVTPGAAQNTVSAAPVTAVPAVTGYTIYRGLAAGGEATVPVATNVALPWVDNGLIAGVTYYYTVAAVNAVGTGLVSPEAMGTPFGGSTHYASFTAADAVIYAPPSSTFNPGGSAFDMQAHVRMTSWVTGGSVETNLFGCWDVTAAKRLWRFGVTTDGRLRASWATGASTSVTAVSGAVIGAPGNTDLWLRAAVNPTSGAVAFYTSADGSSWTSLGPQQTASGFAPVYTPVTSPFLVIGANASAPSGPSAEQFFGRFYEARLYIAGVLVTNPVASATNTTDSRGVAYNQAVVVYV